MDKETYERQRAFAGEKRPSMLWRCVGHDYTERRMYMITMVTEGRQPLFGKVVGNFEAEAGTPDFPKTELTELGRRVPNNWYAIHERHPQVEVIALQMMPDHLHGLLFVKERMEKPLGKVLLGFKQGCNKAYRELVPSVAVIQQQTQQKDCRNHGLLFAPGYNDKILFHQGQLERWPRRIQVQCSRSLTESEIAERVAEALREAEAGAVHVSPAISPGEKAVMRTLLNAHHPLIFLEENGLTPYTKPGGEFFEACSRGELLILAPWEHHNERLLITRDKCLMLNKLTRTICEP